VRWLLLVSQRRNFWRATRLSLQRLLAPLRPALPCLAAPILNFPKAPTSRTSTPACLPPSNALAEELAHSFATPGAVFYPCFRESIRGPKQDPVFTCCGEQHLHSFPPVLEISWHGPSSTMLMSLLPTTTIFLVFSFAAGWWAREVPSR
jgi:hypothetical protein